jgi:hypothetical protein
MAKRQDIVRAVQRLGVRGRGCRYPDELREAIIAYADERRAAGVALESIGHELGVSWLTLSRWSTRPSGFRRVEVAEAADAATTTAGFTVHGAHGVRVEGLALDDVVVLLRRLA